MDGLRLASTKRDRLTQHLLDEVTSGRLSSAEPLPSENVLASTFGVCRNTVRRAFEDLEKQGIIRRIRGKGTFLKRAPASSSRPTQLALYALILPELRRSLYPSLIRGFGQAAGEMTRQVMVCQSGNDIYKQADIILQVMDNKVEGVAMVPTTLPATPAYHVRQLQQSGIAVVFCHRGIPEVQAPCVTWDWQEVGRLAAQTLLSYGHKRIGMITPMRYRVPEAYWRGIQEAMLSAGEELPDDNLDMGASENVKAALEKMLSRSPKITALFCNDEQCAEELYLWALDQGLRVPGDLSIICAGDAAREGAIARRLACVSIDESQLGQKAAELLQEITSGMRGMQDAENVHVPLSVSEGETIGKV